MSMSTSIGFKIEIASYMIGILLIIIMAPTRIAIMKKHKHYKNRSDYKFVLTMMIFGIILLLWPIIAGILNKYTYRQSFANFHKNNKIV